jgi:hypothetical protein
LLSTWLSKSGPVGGPTSPSGQRRTPFAKPETSHRYIAVQANVSESRVMKLTRSLAVGVFLGLTIGMPACSSPVPGGNPCLPEPLQIDPAQVISGSSVTLSSAPFQCGGSYPAGKTYQLTLGLVGRTAPVDLGSYPVKVDGSFRATILIPSDASPGEAYIIIHGSPFDQCDDSGHGSCAGYGVGLKIIPPTAPSPVQKPSLN